MNPVFSQILIEESISKKKKEEPPPAYSRKKKSGSAFVTGLKNVILVTLGIASAAFGLKSFLLPNDFIDGGATGISLLISEVTSTPLSLLLILVNIPFLFFGYNVIGHQFSLRAASAIAGLALTIAFFDFPILTQDKLLVAVFGGFFLGAGIGLSVRGGAVLDGTEVLAIYVSRRLRIRAGDVIIVINVFIFSAAAYFLSFDTAFYSMLTYLAASKTLDFVIEGIEEYTGVTIISAESDKIRHMITEKLGRGVTIYKGSRGFGAHGEVGNLNIIFTVITRLEVSKLYAEIDALDEKAFVVLHSIKDTRGGMIKRRPLD